MLVMQLLEALRASMDVCYAVWASTYNARCEGVPTNELAVKLLSEAGLLALPSLQGIGTRLFVIIITKHHDCG